MTIATIPLNKLIVSPSNVRKTDSGVGIEQLAASIVNRRSNLTPHCLIENITEQFRR